MQEKTVTIKNPTGLHARPAAELVKTAGGFPCNVTLFKGEKKSNAKSIISVLSLGVGQNDQIKVITDGGQEQEALEAVVNFLGNLME